MRYYPDENNIAHATHGKSILATLLLCLFLTVVDLLSLLFITIPCLRSLYARQNNSDYNIALQQQEITALQRQCAEMEKELRLLKQDRLILSDIDQGRDFVVPKE